LIGVYLLMPVVKRELMSFLAFTKRVDQGETIEEAEAATKIHHF
jgi:hypothetical protein